MKPLFVWLSLHWWKLLLSVSVLTIVISVAYYLLISLPRLQEQQTTAQINYEQQQEQDKEDAEKNQQEQIQNNNLDRSLCLSEASDNYTANWSNACKIFGISNKGPNCTLPITNANVWNNTLQQDKDNCLKEYPAN